MRDAGAFRSTHASADGGTHARADDWHRDQNQRGRRGPRWREWGRGARCAVNYCTYVLDCLRRGRIGSEARSRGGCRRKNSLHGS